MVMRSQRLQRYSQNYRDSVVRQILDFEATFLEQRRKLELTETELMDWIIDYVTRLERQLSLLAVDLPNRPEILQIATPNSSIQPNHPK